MDVTSATELKSGAIAVVLSDGQELIVPKAGSGWVADLLAAYLDDGGDLIPPSPDGPHVWDGTAWVADLPADADRVLTPPQFVFLLALTGFDDVWSSLEAGAKGAGDMVTFATLKAERARSAFRLDRTLEIVSQFRAVAAQIAPGVDLSDVAIRAAWDQAEAFKGGGA